MSKAVGRSRKQNPPFRDFAVLQDQLRCHVGRDGKIHWNLTTHEMDGRSPVGPTRLSFAASKEVIDEYPVAEDEPDDEGRKVFELTQFALGTSISRGDWVFHTPVGGGRYLMSAGSERGRMPGTPFTAAALQHMRDHGLVRALGLLPGFVRSYAPPGHIVDKYPWFLLVEKGMRRRMLEYGRGDVGRKIAARRKVTEFVGEAHMAEIIANRGRKRHPGQKIVKIPATKEPSAAGDN